MDFRKVICTGDSTGASYSPHIMPRPDCQLFESNFFNETKSLQSKQFKNNHFNTMKTWQNLQKLLSQGNVN